MELIAQHYSIIYYYNNLFYPRDTKDQIKYSRKKSKKNI